MCDQGAWWVWFYLSIFLSLWVDHKTIHQVATMTKYIYEHVTSVYHIAYYHLKNIHWLKAFLTQKAFVPAVHPYHHHWIQNGAVCIVTNTQKYDHITPILLKLHWLYRICISRFYYQLIYLPITWCLNICVSPWVVWIKSLLESLQKTGVFIFYVLFIFVTNLIFIIAFIFIDYFLNTHLPINLKIKRYLKSVVTDTR